MHEGRDAALAEFAVHTARRTVQLDGTPPLCCVTMGSQCCPQRGPPHPTKALSLEGRDATLAEFAVHTARHAVQLDGAGVACEGRKMPMTQIAVSVQWFAPHLVLMTYGTTSPS